MTRNKIHSKIKSNIEKIKKLELQNIELKKQDMLICDKWQQYFEREKDVIISKRPKVIEKQLHGFIKWKEDFVDEDNGEVFSIERNQLVRVNGDWL
jgi:hypothetical protein